MAKTFESYEQALQFIRNYEKENGYKFLKRAIARGFTDKLSSIFHRKVLCGRNDLPYLHVSNGKMWMVCGQGGRKYERCRKHTDMSTVTGQRKRLYSKRSEEPSKGGPPCPAEITILSLIYFPDYKVAVDIDKQKLVKTIDHLRKNFSSETACVPHFIVEIDETHSNHRVNLPQTLDSRMTDMCQTLVERGYYTATDIYQQLEKFYETLPIKPETTDPKFYPGMDRIRRITYPLVVKQRNLEREKGFTAEWTEALMRMGDYEKDTCTTYICSQYDVTFSLKDVFESAKTNQIQTSPDHDLRCRIDTCGVPYMILGTQHYECRHGVDYRNKFVGPYTTSQRKHMDKEGMTPCSARCTFKELALFPSYRIDRSVTQRNMRDAIIEKLKEDLSNQTAVYEKVIAYAFPCVDEHSGHAVKEANGHLLLDETIQKQIYELVSEGVRSIAEMRRHLKMYLKHNFDDLSMPGPFNKKYRPSNQTIINIMHEAGVQPEYIVLDVKDPLLEYSGNAGNKERLATDRPIIVDAHDSTEISVDMELEHDEVEESRIMYQTKQNMQNESQQQFVEPALTTTTTTYSQRTIDTLPNVDTFRSESTEQNTDHFQDVLFQKQSECQSLLEEILQTVYQLSDMFRLRDLRELLQRVILCLKKGDLLCDGLPVSVKDETQMNISHEEGAHVVELVSTNENTDIDTCDETTTTTRLLILNQNKEVTEVNLPNDYHSSEIVIYQEDGDAVKQIVVVDQNSGQGKVNRLDGTQGDSDHDQGDEGEEIRKDMINVKCKRHIPQEEIIKRLNLADNKRSKLSMSSDSGKMKQMSDIEREIKNQENELMEFERDKVRLSVIEAKAITEEQQRSTITERKTKEYKKQSRRQTRKCSSSVINVDKCRSSTDIEETFVRHLNNAQPKDANSETVVTYGDTAVQTDHTHDLDVSSNKQSFASTVCSAMKLKKCVEANSDSTSDQSPRRPVDNKSGDTITFQLGTGSALSDSLITNQTVQPGFVAINNVLYSNTAVGFFPALKANGMPIMVNNQSAIEQIGAHKNQTEPIQKVRQTVPSENDLSLKLIRSFRLTSDDSNERQTSTVKEGCLEGRGNVEKMHVTTLDKEMSVQLVTTGNRMDHSNNIHHRHSIDQTLNKDFLSANMKIETEISPHEKGTVENSLSEQQIHKLFQSESAESLRTVVSTENVSHHVNIETQVSGVDGTAISEIVLTKSTPKPIATTTCARLANIGTQAVNDEGTAISEVASTKSTPKPIATTKSARLVENNSHDNKIDVGLSLVSDTQADFEMDSNRIKPEVNKTFMQPKSDRRKTSAKLKETSPSLTVKTRGRIMRFSKTGEKLS